MAAVLSRDLTTTCLLILFALIMARLSAARSLDTTMKTAKASTLVARLKLEEGSCWDSLFQLQSCTGEVILFFLNGETKLGGECCKAIGHIEEYCWPSMMVSLGFTSQEEQVLRGYCDKENAGRHPH